MLVAVQMVLTSTFDVPGKAEERFPRYMELGAAMSRTLAQMSWYGASNCISSIIVPRGSILDASS